MHPPDRPDSGTTSASGRSPCDPSGRTGGATLVTGAGGFVGRHLCRALAGRGESLRPVSRRAEAAPRGDIGLLETDPARLAAALEGTRCVYFLAGVAHEAVAKGDPDTLHRVNVDAPLRWLTAADRAGVERFVWLSSIKVLGERSAEPLRVDAPYRPGDPYARSKVDAERRLQDVPLTSTQLAIVRPPLVYGPEVRGNFAALLRFAAAGRWSPFGAATAPRSMVAVDNLCSLLLRLGQDGRGVFHVADAEDVSAAELIVALRRLLAQPARQVAVPPGAMRLLLGVTGRGAAYRRLYEPLRVDTRQTRDDLGWEPAVSTGDALAKTVEWLRSSG